MKCDEGEGEFSVEKVSEFIVKQRKWILACFVVLVIASGIASTFVNVNHDMVQYLPNRLIGQAGR